jgi:SAM-dependent methyltransferase
MGTDIEIIGESRYSSTTAILDRIVRPGTTVVEIGANDASFRDMYWNSKWITVDKHGSPDVAADIDGPKCKLPFEDESADVVLCTEVLEHLLIGSPLVKEMARVVRRSGTVVVSVPNVASLKSRIKVLFGRLPNMAASGDCGPSLGGFGFLSDGCYVGGHVVDFNERRLKGYLYRGGLEISRFHTVPITIELPSPIGKRKRVTLAPWMYPRTFSDFILCESRRIGAGEC